MVDSIDQPRVDDRVRGVRVGKNDEVTDERGHEQKRTGGEQIRPRLAIGAGKGLDVEAPDSSPHLAAAAVDDAVAARDEAVQVAMDRLPGPVALCPREVGRRAPIQRGQGQHLRRAERVHLTGAGAREKVLQAVPVVAAQGDEVFGPHAR